jgi:hypothetical protein
MAPATPTDTIGARAATSGEEPSQSEHHTGKKTYQHYYQGRCGADIKYLVHDLSELLSPEDIDKGQQKENSHCAQVVHEADGLLTDNRKNKR